MIVPILALGFASAAVLRFCNRKRRLPASAHAQACYIENFDARIVQFFSRKSNHSLQLLDYCVDSSKHQFPTTAIFICTNLVDGSVELVHLPSQRKLSAKKGQLSLSESSGKCTAWKDIGQGWLVNSSTAKVVVRIHRLEIIPRAHLETLVASQRSAVAAVTHERSEGKKKMTALSQKIDVSEGQIVRLRLRLDETKAEVVQLTSQLKSHRISEVRSERDLELARSTIESLQIQVSGLKLQLSEKEEASKDVHRKKDELDLRCSVQEEALKLIKARLFLLSSGVNQEEEGEGEGGHWGSLESLHQPHKETFVADQLSSLAIVNQSDLARSRDQLVTPPAPASVKAIQRFHVIRDSCDATPNLASARDINKMKGVREEGEPGIESPARPCVSLFSSKQALMTSGKRRIALDSSSDDDS